MTDVVDDSPSEIRVLKHLLVTGYPESSALELPTCLADFLVFDHCTIRRESLDNSQHVFAGQRNRLIPLDCLMPAYINLTGI